ncbi:hypothetical protein DPX16_22365 [Anabarilius grahami]|uniref:Uncharacterized protein n=1 Tax=Anabarilius grahami TaxID=495550 RepID=A0A3N0Y4K4_ANAGA|nr:hypothetical protein DPX16_22365 [Anabarilius grahami]
MRKRRRQVRILGRYYPQLSGLKEDEPLCRSRCPSRLGPKRERSACGRRTPPPYLDPSYPPTALPSRFPGTTRTPGRRGFQQPSKKRRVVELSVHMFPAGLPFQGTGLTVHPKKKKRVATRALPQKAWGQGQATQTKSSCGKTDLRTVIITKKASKRS